MQSGAYPVAVLWGSHGKAILSARMYGVCVCVILKTVCACFNEYITPSLCLPPPLPFSLQKEAVTWAWDVLTNVYKLPKDRLYVTYFEGNPELNLPVDAESRDMWLSLG